MQVKEVTQKAGQTSGHRARSNEKQVRQHAFDYIQCILMDLKAATGPGAMKERVLLLVVSLAVDFGVSEEAGGGEGLLACCALETLLVPGRVVDAHEEAV